MCIFKRKPKATDYEMPSPKARSGYEPQLPPGWIYSGVENTNSMEPLIDEGCRVIWQPYSQVNEVHVGDIIWFNIFYNNNWQDICHQIVEETTLSSGDKAFKTKGVNPLLDVDPWIVPEGNIKYVFRGVIW
jgi:hypothetical protein